MEKEVTQPMNIVFVRHGQSEANVVQHAEKNGGTHVHSEKVYERHDFEHPLTLKGVAQAKAARTTLKSLGMTPQTFNEFYVSPYKRTKETAAYIGRDEVNWLPEIRLIERDWGLYGSTPLTERIVKFADTERRRERNSFYTRYENGESIPDVIGRVRDWLSTLNREMTNKSVLAVTHGELMWAARYVLEGLTPEQWVEMDTDKSLRIGNCCILWYSRQNPEDPTEISPNITGGWRRMVDPYEPENSPYGGEWQKLQGRARLLGAELLRKAEMQPRYCDK